MAIEHHHDQFQSLVNGISRRAALGCLTGSGMALALVATRDQANVLAQATPAAVLAGAGSNHFVLTGGETNITFDATTLAGKPGLTYQGPYGDHSLTGQDLTIEDCELGRLVTGDLGAFPDQGHLWLTLLLPAFNPMEIGDEPASFATLAILKWKISTIAGPPREGALESYVALSLDGTAQIVAS